jgi:hypothetical protein
MTDQGEVQENAKERPHGKENDGAVGCIFPMHETLRVGWTVVARVSVAKRVELAPELAEMSLRLHLPRFSKPIPSFGIEVGVGDEADGRFLEAPVQLLLIDQRSLRGLSELVNLLDESSNCGCGQINHSLARENAGEWLLMASSDCWRQA